MARFDRGSWFIYNPGTPERITGITKREIELNFKQPDQVCHSRQSHNANSKLVVRGSESNSGAIGQEEIIVAFIEGSKPISAPDVACVHKRIMQIVEVEVEEARAKFFRTALNSAWEQVNYAKEIAEEWDLCIGDAKNISIWAEIIEAKVEKKEKFEDWVVLEIS